MSSAELHVSLPEVLGPFVRSAPLGHAIQVIGQLAGTHVAIECAPGIGEPVLPADGAAAAIPIQYRGQTRGLVTCRGTGAHPMAAQAAHSITTLMEHALDREMAVTDLADAMNTSFEELNMLYSLMSEIVTRTYAPDIGQVVVDETVRILNCRRVSLLVLDEEHQRMRVLAARGLPAEAMRSSIPVTGTIAGEVLLDDELLLVNRLADRPDLAARSHGTYQTQSFLVVRVPLMARGEPLGILTATERNDKSEFTSRDRRLVEGLSSLAASALLNCQLHSKINRQMIGTIRAMACAVDAKDVYTHDHSARVADLCIRVADHMGLTSAQQSREIELASLLHDIGKIGISDAVLGKSGRLTPQEHDTIKQHSRIGAHIVQQVQGLDGVAKAILHHHERYDGLGYPAGLARETIPLASRLIAVADAFDAITTDRPYRRGLSVSKALRELQRNSGTQFAPEAVAAITESVMAMGPGGQERGMDLCRRTVAKYINSPA
jgi:putative nucleotidyltransferase with HDIG domain